ncbi:uncharacterized protein CTRU02_212398 [Colletotrichum truncatum]|uniref:Uncharacterized protein n=1 Tax=Colletotrichum truncatum TaxID=5467 RepID=A0ACC3YNF5_COLTU|nr:uncharacterized protein CTRU02_08730 [Colletotrichum truncatum]KAF6789483.1 hypothetical protein CTRU02_08730 [Colletotrichum truncatum]
MAEVLSPVCALEGPVTMAQTLALRPASPFLNPIAVPDPRLPRPTETTAGFSISSKNTVSPEDWESKKEIIHQLYLRKNLPLHTIQSIMSQHHSFFATERMYKRQFLKWKWKKYNTKTLQDCLSNGDALERSHGKTTCQRSARRNLSTIGPQRNGRFGHLARLFEQKQDPVIPSALLTYGTRHDQLTYGLFVSLRDLIYGTSRRDPCWAGREKFSIPESSAYGIDNLFRTATKFYSICDFLQAGATFRRAFYVLEDVIDNEAINTFRVLFLDIPYVIPTDEIRGAYLCHISQLLDIKKREQPIAKIAMMLHRIHMEACEHIFEHLYQMHIIAADYFSEIRGRDDIQTLDFAVDAALLRPDANNPQVLEYYLKMYDEILRNVIDQYGPLSAEALDIEYWKLVSAGYLNLSFETLMELSNGFLPKLSAINNDGSLNTWSSSCLWLYSIAARHVSTAAFRSNDPDSGITWLERSVEALQFTVEVEASEGTDTFETNCALTQFRVELLDHLSELGRVQEADEIRAALAASEFMEEVMQNDLGENFDQILAC